MKTVVAFVALMILCSACDHRVPLSGEAAGPADRTLVGLWSRTENSTEHRLLILPLGPREWLVGWSAGGSTMLYARGWPVRWGETQLAQLEWIGTGEGRAAEGDRPFQLAAWSVAGRELTIRLVNGDVGREATNATELAAALEAARARGQWLRDPMVFRRVESHQQ